MIGTSLRTHLSSNGVDPELRRVIDFLGKSCKYISEAVKIDRGEILNTKNSTGDTQVALDILTHNLLEERLSEEKSFGIREFVTEESQSISHLSTKGEGKYSVAIDPLDGSSLVDVNLSVGTIVGIHDGEILGGKTGDESLVAAMYIVYGPKTTLMYSAGQGTHNFSLDYAGEFVLTNENIQMKDQGKIYSPGGLRTLWAEEHKKFIEDLEQTGYKLRYSGGLVPDINQILLKGGGIFTYPALKDAPNGKLRLLFEIQQMAFLIEQAGGSASDGKKRILDIVPTDIDQRTPIYIGSKKEVEVSEKYLSGKY